MKTQKVWFITGASKGFGFEIVKAALAHGDKVVATVRKNPEKLINDLNNPVELQVVVLNVTNEPEVIAGVKKAEERFGRIDLVVNNAGYGLVGATEEASDEETRQQYDTNVFGLLNVIRAVLPGMRAQKSGHIINISSLFGYSAAYPGLNLYGSTKYAVEGISEGLALEVNPFGIHVTAAAPGLFSTEFNSADSYRTAAIELNDYAGTVGHARQVMGQLHGHQPGDPAKLAKVILTLANSENPPLHLPIGKDAVASFRAGAAKVAKDVDAWEKISSSTDHLAV